MNVQIAVLELSVCRLISDGMFLIMFGNIRPSTRNILEQLNEPLLSMYPNSTQFTNIPVISLLVIKRQM